MEEKEFDFGDLSLDSFGDEDFSLSGFGDDYTDEVENNLIGDSSSDKAESLFNHTYSITPLGINFNVLLKDSPDVLVNNLSLELTSVEGRSRIKEFFLDCDIFVKHIDAKIDSIDKRLYETAINIFQTFTSNLEYLKRNLNIFDYNSANLGDELKSFEKLTGNKNMSLNKDISIYDLTDRESLNRVEDDIINYRYSDLTKSPIHDYHREFSSLLTAHQGINELLVKIKLLSKDDPNNTVLGLINKERSSANPTLDLTEYNKVKGMVEYSHTAYQYTDEELEVMEIMDFPYTICGRESFLKTDMNAYILNVVKNRTDYTNTAGKTNLKSERENALLLKLNKTKVYLANKEGNSTMGALYF